MRLDKYQIFAILLFIGLSDCASYSIGKHNADKWWQARVNQVLRCDFYSYEKATPIVICQDTEGNVWHEYMSTCHADRSQRRLTK